MCLYTALMAIVDLIVGIILAVRTKKAENVNYNKLDKAGRITNVLLIPVYLFLTIFCMGISMFSTPGYEGFLGILGWIVCVIIASAPLSCGIGLGYSVLLRKKGESKRSFIVQFLGFAGNLLSFALFMLFYGNLLASLN